MAQEIGYRIVALLPRLRAFAYALTRHRADADDLVQQTCERALGAAASFAEDTRLDSWLFRIMRNLQIDAWRRNRPHVALDEPGIADRLIGEDGCLVGEQRLEMARVWEVMGQLPDEQRAVLVLVCVEGLKYREAAEILDMPIGTVMSRLSRARLAIADALEGGVAFPWTGSAEGDRRT